jgi:hypothetical protein
MRIDFRDMLSQHNILEQQGEEYDVHQQPGHALCWEKDR